MKPDSARPTGDELRRLSSDLEERGGLNGSRRTWLKSASLGVVGATAFGSFLAACGEEDEGEQTAAGGATGQQGLSGPSAEVANTAITAEALAITFLTGVVQQAPGTEVEQFSDVLKAANAAEYDHYQWLQNAGAEPLTTRFWVPDAFFGDQLASVFGTLETAEMLFVNAYLIAATEFTNADRPELARYANEVGSVEAEHLVLALFAQGKMPPNNIAFTAYDIKEIGGIVEALENAGVGFGEQGKKPGDFYEFPGEPPEEAVVEIENTEPM